MWRVIADPERAPRTVGAKPDDSSDGAGPWRVSLALLALLQAATNMIFFVMPTQISFFLASRGHASPVMTGAILGVLMVSGGCLALLYPRIQRGSGYGGVFLLGYGAMALGFLLLPLAGATWLLFLAAAAIGAGYALVSPSFVALALNLAPRAARGLAGGILTSSIFIGQFCSPLISTPLIAAHGYPGLFQGTAGLLASMAAIAALASAAAWLRRRTGAEPARSPCA